MRTHYFSFIAFTFLAFTQAFGQNKRTFDPTNAREGEKVELNKIKLPFKKQKTKQFLKELFTKSLSFFMCFIIME
jgi:hypothetical protein